jgi:hypothetical protein
MERVIFFKWVLTIRTTSAFWLGSKRQQTTASQYLARFASSFSAE